MQTAFPQELWEPVFHSENTHWADSILANLSEQDRIAQLFMVAAYSNKATLDKEEISALIKDYKIGGLMFLQGSPEKQAKKNYSSKAVYVRQKRPVGTCVCTWQ